MQPCVEGDITWKYKKKYTWKYVVGYLKYGARLMHFDVAAQNPNPLGGLGLLGYGAYLRRMEEDRSMFKIVQIINFGHN